MESKGSPAGVFPHKNKPSSIHISQQSQESTSGVVKTNLTAPLTPRIDISRASSSSYHEDSSPENVFDQVNFHGHFSFHISRAIFHAENFIMTPQEIHDHKVKLIKMNNWKFFHPIVVSLSQEGFSTVNPRTYHYFSFTKLVVYQTERELLRNYVTFLCGFQVKMFECKISWWKLIKNSNTI